MMEELLPLLKDAAVVICHTTGVFELPCCKEACQSKPACPSSVYIHHHIMETL